MENNFLSRVNNENSGVVFLLTALLKSALNGLRGSGFAQLVRRAPEAGCPDHQGLRFAHQNHVCDLVAGSTRFLSVQQ